MSPVLGGLRTQWRKTKFSKRRRTLPAVTHLVTPMTPFLLSDYFLSDEVEKKGLRFVNRRSKPLRRTLPQNIADASVIYVSSSELDIFISQHLPRIKSRFILITGKMTSPAPPEPNQAGEILNNPYLIEWFAQNLEDSSLGIRPFPYGVAFWNSPNVLSAQQKNKHSVRGDSIYVPHSAIHSHLVDPALRIRTALKPLMAKPQRHQDYLRELSQHRFVISPPGDRPDTFRHWECVAMGAIPVSELPNTFQDLFGDSIVLVDNLVAKANGPIESERIESNRELATVDYWRAVLDATKRLD